MERIERWRREELERAGYEPRAAGRIAVRHDVDLHCRGRAARARLPRAELALESCSSPSRASAASPGRIPARDRSLDPVADTGTIDWARSSLHMYGLMLLLGDRGVRRLTGVRWPAAAATGTSCCASRSGASRPGSSARGSTTSSRAGTRFPTRSGRASSRSGKAASACGAGSCSARRRRDRRQALGRERARVHGRGGARAAARAGHRPHRNWFNQELYGKPTDLPWGLEIDIDHRHAAVRATRPSTRRSSTS